MRATLFAAFAAFGFLFGIWQVLLPDLSRSLSLTPGQLGLALSAGFLVALPAMAWSGRVLDQMGAWTGVAGGAFALTAVFVALPLASDYGLLLLLMVAFVTASGVYDVAINAAAVDVEQGGGQRVLPQLHATFSLGGLAGALTAGVLVAGGMPFRGLYPLTGAVLAVVVMAGLRQRATQRRLLRARVEAPTPAGRRRLYREPVVVLLGVIVALAFLSEGGVESWSAIYLRSSLDLPVLFGASGVAMFHAAMALGRAASGRLAAFRGPVALMSSAGMAVAIGTAVALTTDVPALVFIGFAVAALGMSSVAPIAFSVAGDHAPDRSGEASAVLNTIGYGGFLLGPGLIGAIAELSSLRLGLAVVALAGIAIALLSRPLGEARRRRTAAHLPVAG